MNIIILGSGQVGSTVAHSLADEQNDITVVDIEPGPLQALQEQLDIRTVIGPASSPRVLEEAGAGNADLLLAATNSDETNMLACQVAHSLFRVPTLIARIRSSDYLAYPALFKEGGIPIDVMISPEQLVTRHIRLLIEYPSAIQVREFAGGRAVLVEIRAAAGSPAVGRSVGGLADRLPGVPFRVVAVYRGKAAVAIDGPTVIEADDDVFLVTVPDQIRRLASEFRELALPCRRVLIAGGGHVGMGLAQALEGAATVKVIEHNRARAEYLAEALDDAVVLNGDATDKSLLADEDIEKVDVFCALTNDDEDNIMAALMARRLGARRTIALINRPTYVELMADSAIDVVVAPQLITMGAILPHVRRGDVVVAHSLRGGVSEALEAVVHGDLKTSRVAGRTVAEVALPPTASFAAIVRGTKVMMASGETRIESDDHVILLLGDKRYLRDLEKIFQVDVLYL
ncbi:MAG: Trk system potassium transporter TrkA [Burkholderiales bacterium]